MTSTRPAARYRGVFPVVPTIFDEHGALDLAGQKRCVDFMIDAGSNGLCILANFSEQFVLGDDERETLTRTILEHVAGRVPVIVTTTHFSTDICLARGQRAQAQGAAMVMVMPPYHGATLRVGEKQIHHFFGRLSDGLEIPIMIQDAPMAGTPLPAAFLARMAQRLRAGALLQDRDRRRGQQAARADRDRRRRHRRPVGRRGGDHAAGRPRRRRHRRDDRRRAIPDGIRTIVDAYAAGRREEAVEAYGRWLPLINYENRQGGFLAAKALMKEGGIIACDAPRCPYPAMSDARARRPARRRAPARSAGAALGPLSASW